MSKLTYEEVREDLLNTDNDIFFLGNIIDGMRKFMTHSGGEDRRFIRIDILKYENMLNTAKELRDRISKEYDRL